MDVWERISARACQIMRVLAVGSLPCRTQYFEHRRQYPRTSRKILRRRPTKEPGSCVCVCVVYVCAYGHACVHACAHVYTTRMRAQQKCYATLSCAKSSSRAPMSRPGSVVLSQALNFRIFFVRIESQNKIVVLHRWSEEFKPLDLAVAFTLILSLAWALLALALGARKGVEVRLIERAVRPN